MSLFFRTYRRKCQNLGLSALLVSLCFAGPSGAQETINLTAIDGYPTKALWVKEFINFYIPAVDKELAKTGKYKINWNKAFGGQIVKPKHVLEGIQKGLGDIGVVTTVFHQDKVPLQAIAYVTPFVTTDPTLVAHTMDGLAAKFPAVKKAWRDYNQIYLTSMAVFDSYQVFSKKPIGKLSDFKGLKINGAGINLRYLQGLGSAGVGGSLVTYYQNLNTGVVDGALIWPEAAMAFKLNEVAPNMLKGNLGSANSKAVTVNADTWKRLPEEVRLALHTAAIAYRDHMGKLATERGASSDQGFRKQGGRITDLPEEERKAWADGMPNIAKKWAADLEKKGIPGKEILTNYMDTMRANDQPIARQWDKE